MVTLLWNLWQIQKKNKKNNNIPLVLSSAEYLAHFPRLLSGFLGVLHRQYSHRYWNTLIQSNQIIQKTHAYIYMYYMYHTDRHQMYPYYIFILLPCMKWMEQELPISYRCVLTRCETFPHWMQNCCETNTITANQCCITIRLLRVSKHSISKVTR